MEGPFFGKILFQTGYRRNQMYYSFVVCLSICLSICDFAFTGATSILGNISFIQCKICLSLFTGKDGSSVIIDGPEPSSDVQANNVEREVNPVGPSVSTPPQKRIVNHQDMVAAYSTFPGKFCLSVN